MVAPALLVMLVVPALVVPLVMTGSANVPAPLRSPELKMKLEPVPVLLISTRPAVVPPVTVAPAATKTWLLPEPVPVVDTPALPVPLPVTAKVGLTLTVALPLTTDVVTPDDVVPVMLPFAV